MDVPLNVLHHDRVTRDLKRIVGFTTLKWLFHKQVGINNQNGAITLKSEKAGDFNSRRKMLPRHLWFYIFDFVNLEENPSFPSKIKQKYKNILFGSGDKYANIWLRNGFSMNPAAIYYLSKNPDMVNVNHLCKNPNPYATELIAGGLSRENVFNLLMRPHGYVFLSGAYPDFEVTPGLYYALFRNPAAIDIIYNILRFDNDPPSVKYLSANPAALEIMEELGVEYSSYISLNPNPRAFEIIAARPNLLNWKLMCRNENPRALDLLRDNMDKIHWEAFCERTSPAAIKMLEENTHLFNEFVWDRLCSNPAALHLIEQMAKIDIFSLARNPAIFEVDKTAIFLPNNK